jgi:hypothetical protein
MPLEALPSDYSALFLASLPLSQGARESGVVNKTAYSGLRHQHVSNTNHSTRPHSARTATDLALVSCPSAGLELKPSYGSGKQANLPTPRKECDMGNHARYSVFCFFKATPREVASKHEYPTTALMRVILMASAKPSAPTDVLYIYPICSFKRVLQPNLCMHTRALSYVQVYICRHRISIPPSSTLVVLGNSLGRKKK